MNDKPVALVTGASSGIGRSAALALARAGYDLVINYASSKDRAEQVAKEAEQLGARAVTAQADVADDAAVCGWKSAASATRSPVPCRRRSSVVVECASTAW